MAGQLTVTLDGRRYVLQGGEDAWIGRDLDAMLRSDDARVSRRHATITLGPDGWVFVDSSANGSFVASRKVERVALTPGVRVRLGNSVDGPVLGVASVGETLEPAIVSVELGQRTSVHVLEPAIRIGRAAENDIVLDDLVVSRQHAEVRRRADGRYEVTDLGSHNGTYLNGESVTTGILEPGAILSVGHHLFTLGMRGLEEYVDVGRVKLQVSGLQVRLRDGRRLLDDVSFALEESSLLAVVGPTGAGKSTLMKALTGFRPAESGRVLYGGRDLYQNLGELRRRIGYVPQDDILHLQLSARRALGYAAELRFPPDTSSSERGRRIEEVLKELGLMDRADLAIGRLSGGQRKRTSVALELLTRPSLLVLDEPTSGLDPGYERVLMTLFRELARGGRTVVVVTHSLQSLDLCDRALFLAPGGRTAFFGRPGDALEYFGRTNYPDVFRDLEQGRDIDWTERFAASRFYDTNVRRPLSALASPPISAGSRERSANWLRQFSTLVRRYVAVIRAETRNFWLLVLQGPFLGLLMLAAMPEGGLEKRTGPNPEAHTVLLTLMISGTFLGASNSIREIVKERAIFRRERAVGLAPSAYIASKAVVLAALTIAQSLVFVFLALLRQNGPAESVFIAPPALELAIDVVLTGLAAMTVGLIVSAFVRNPDLALTMLPLLLLTELILSGALFVLGDKPILREASYLAGSRWGFAMTAGTADLRHLELQSCAGGPKDRLECEKWSDHTSVAWNQDATILGGLIGVGLIGAWLSVRRTDSS